MRKFILTPLLLLFSFIGLGNLNADPIKTQDEHCPCVYGSFFTKENVSVIPEHTIPFDREAVHSRGIHHPEGSGDFLIKEPGIYRVTYSVSLRDKGGMVALTLDDRIVEGSEMIVGDDCHLSTLSVLVNMCEKSCCDHVLRLVNNHPLNTGWYNNEICLKGDKDGVSGSIVIERVCCCEKCKFECKCNGDK